MHLICNVEHKSQINQIIQLELKSGFNLAALFYQAELLIIAAHLLSFLALTRADPPYQSICR